MAQNNNGTYGQGLVTGLAPIIDIPEVGRVFQDTTNSIAAKVAELLRTQQHITELDNIIISPTMAKNQIGASDLTVVAYFVTKNGKNIFYRGKGNNNSGSGGRVNMLATAGTQMGGTGNYGTSQEFDAVMKGLCKYNEKGKPIMNIRKVPNNRDVAALELDWTAVLSLALGITENDPYDFTILGVTPLGSNTNFSIMIMKKIVSDASQKGKASGINYNRISQDLFNSLNRGNGNRGGNGGNNNGGRSY